MINRFSKYRNQLMGLMILWIMFFHVNMTVPSGLLTTVKAIGYGGVDGFLFLAGMGAYCSLRKNPSPLAYYRRRLGRLLPTYYPILALWLLFTIWTEQPQNVIGVIFGNITGQAFWNLADIRFNWYIQSIWLFYGLAPLLVRLTDLPDRRYIRGIFLFFLLMNTAYFGRFTLIAISRLPIFIFGIYAGKLLCEGRSLPKGSELLSWGCAVLGFLLLFFVRRNYPDTLWKYGMHWHPFLLIIPGLFALLCHMFSFFSRNRYLNVLNSLLGRLGQCSFELYLVHVFFFEGLHRNSPKFLAAAIVIAFLYRFLIEKARTAYARLPRQQAES